MMMRIQIRSTIMAVSSKMMTRRKKKKMGIGCIIME